MQRQKISGRACKGTLRNRLATTKLPVPPELAVGTVVETVNLILARIDDADKRQHDRRDPYRRDFEHRSDLHDYTILPCVIWPALEEA